MDGAAVVSDMWEVEFVDEALGAISQAIGELVMRDDYVARVNPNWSSLCGRWLLGGPGSVCVEHETLVVGIVGRALE